MNKPKMDKKNVTISMRTGYPEKLARVAKQRGVSQGKVVESHLDKIKEPDHEKL